MAIVIIGSGLAGLTTALSLAPQPVTLVVQHPLGKGCSSDWAQGGLSAAVGDDDTPAFHAADTMKAGVGLCDAAIVQQVTGDGAAVVRFLTQHGAHFDADAAGKLRLHLEGAHSRRRVVHASDETGHVIMQALAAAVRNSPHITMRTNVVVTDILTDDSGVTGVVVSHAEKSELIATDKVVLATGGAAALWQHTTNPLGNWGSGLALAARAGARLADLEFMQFHPTALDIGRDPMPLASEALRGEGALLLNDRGERFMASYARKELEPRDVVSRAIWQQMQAGQRVYLDLRPLGEKFTHDFPVVAALCASAHLQPLTTPVPITPAAHYHMGGIAVDARGRSDVAGLWACGEVASTGLHGANRLASNSLLEAVSSGMRVADDMKGCAARATVTPSVWPAQVRPCPVEATHEIRALMMRHVGVLRDKAGLEQAIAHLQPRRQDCDMALVGLMIAQAALNRTESRGAHRRMDYPDTAPEWAHRQFMTLKEIIP